MDSLDRVMKVTPAPLTDRLELAAQACRAAHLLSCETTCREAIAALSSKPTPPALPDEAGEIVAKLYSLYHGIRSRLGQADGLTAEDAAVAKEAVFLVERLAQTGSAFELIVRQAIIDWNRSRSSIPLSIDDHEEGQLADHILKTLQRDPTAERIDVSRYDDPDSPDYQETNVGLGMVPARKKKAPAEPVGGPTPRVDALMNDADAFVLHGPAIIIKLARQLERELAQWATWGIVEVAIRNRSVAEYMDHREQRAEKAESEVADTKRLEFYWLEQAKLNGEAAEKYRIEVAELRADAERYRWLRENSLAFRDWKVSRTILNDHERPERQWLHGGSLDEALDASLDPKND